MMAVWLAAFAGEMGEQCQEWGLCGSIRQTGYRDEQIRCGLLGVAVSLVRRTNSTSEEGTTRGVRKECHYKHIGRASLAHTNAISPPLNFPEHKFWKGRGPKMQENMHLRVICS